MIQQKFHPGLEETKIQEPCTPLDLDDKLPRINTNTTHRPRCSDLNNVCITSPGALQTKLKLSSRSCLSSKKCKETSLRSCLSSKKRKSKKSVSFDSDAKTWDGQRQEHILLERLATDFWKPKPDITVLEELYAARDAGMLLKMRDVLCAAIARILKDGKKDAELIPGGGNVGIRVNSTHLPHLRLMLGKITELYDATYLMRFCDS